MGNPIPFWTVSCYMIFPWNICSALSSFPVEEQSYLNKEMFLLLVFTSLTLIVSDQPPLPASQSILLVHFIYHFPQYITV